MKRWWADIIKDYLTFTKKERVGILLLVALGIVAFFSLRLIGPKKKFIHTDAFAKELAQLKITVDSSRQYKSYRNDDDNEYDYYRPKHYANQKTSKGELFQFDPNTLDTDGWKRLGLRDKTIQTIQKFIAKGYKFRQPEDIKRIYGLHEDEANRLIPYISIEITGEATTHNSSNFTASTPVTTTKPELKVRVIDINAADTSAFISLPGIGSKLAARIVNFRDKLGGFVSVQQVAETYGVADSTFQKIKPLLQCDHPSVRTFDINTSEANQLKAHPYIKWNIANAIINYRRQHGNYKSLDELKKIDIITDDVFNKIAPYLKVL